MPDWRRLAARRLRWLRLPPSRRDEIARELAGFLEDRYEQRVGEGIGPRAAAREALASVGGWRELADAIESETNMWMRVKALWLPGFVAAIAALVLSRLPHWSWGGVQTVRLDTGQMVPLIWTWLVTLPFVAALFAEWSRRQGGRRAEQFLVALAPGFALLVIYAVTLLLVGHPASQSAERGPIPGRVMLFVNLVLIPTLPLLVGSLPSLLRREQCVHKC